MATAQLSEMRQPALAVQQPDQVVDMFSSRGFDLAVRIAKAFAHSDAVPAQFRMQVEKKTRDGSQWIENPAALGNCIVAIETARAVGMSITAVMQNANIIEGRLSWSAQFVIAAINASGRFTPLRFQMRNLGRIRASYREKKGWNKVKGGFDFEDKTVEIEDIECIAWALPRNVPIPPNVYSLDQAKAAGLPVIEGAPVSMKLAVEEGWYGKSGSKWQTGMKQLMLQYRAGAFFGRIHAPDVVMGMGRSTEEIIDVAAVEIPSVPAGPTVTLAEIAGGPVREVSQLNDAGDAEQPTTPPQPPAAPIADTSTAADLIKRINACTEMSALLMLNDESDDMPDGPAREEVMAALVRRDGELSAAFEQQQAKAQQQAPRRQRAAGASME